MAADSLIKFGDSQIKKLADPTDIQPRLYNVKNFKDVSPSVFGGLFKNGFGAFWKKLRDKNPEIKDVTHTAFRFMVETTVGLFNV